ncbi:transposase [Brucella oryzae]|uniref:transposase n=1 Tax=Brucella oryzae TaxID=335286 RepID=UPI001B81C5DA|nr:transposase [Brucella oryzae]MBR7654814.1 transposase [Brucella oryzae]
MRVEVLGAERRHRWSDEKKLAIVMSVGIGGATVTDVVQRYDVTHQQIYTWRRELKKRSSLILNRITANYFDLKRVADKSK